MAVMIVAEIGIAHNGNVETALQLIDMARACGFDAVKFQKRNPERYPEKPYMSPHIGQCTYREHKRAQELSEDDYNDINHYCLDLPDQQGIEWFASCFDEESVDFIAKYNPAYWKIASPVMAEDLDLVRYIGRQPGHIIMSTGMSTQDEVDAAVHILHSDFDKKDSEITLLHCCSEYPTPNEHANLCYLRLLKLHYGCRVGYSSHDAGVPLCVAAVALGAEVIEVHITLDRTMPGSDHAASLEKTSMERLVRHIRAVEQALGSTEKQFYDGEKAIREKVRK